MHIINIDIDELGVATPTQVVLGSKYENNDAKIIFKMPSDYDTFHKYLIFVGEQAARERLRNRAAILNTNVLPIQNNEIMVSSALTWTESQKGWYMYVMAREAELDLNQGVVDLTAKNEERVSISEGFIGQVKQNFIDPANLQNAPLDSNLITAYDELIALKKEIESKLASGQFNGFSPTVNIQKSDKTTTITITDSVGPHVFEIVDGTDGVNGLSAYEIASNNGFVGTEKEWIESLKYDHSDEFSQLATQINQNVQSAQTSAQAAKTSEVNAKASEDKSKISETNAKASETASKESETNAKSSETATSRMAQEANSSAQTATEKATLATESATAAKASESNAKLSETNAKTSETNASKSATAAKASETATGQVVADATAQANRAKTEADRAKTNADTVASSTQKIDKNATDITQLKQDLPKLAIKDKSSGNPCMIGDSAEWKLQGLDIYGQSEQNGTPTPDAPVPIINKEISEIKITGSNLIPSDDIKKTKDNIYCGMSRGLYLKKNLTYIFSVDGPEASGLYFIKLGDSKPSAVAYQKKFLKFTPTENGLYYLNLYQSSKSNGIGITEEQLNSIRLNIEKDYGYEPYKEQTVTLSQPIILQGIPVDSGGNYTDDTGQQWICDEIDLARGKYVQRLKKSSLEATSKVSDTIQDGLSCMCSFQALTDAPTSNFGSILCNILENSGTKKANSIRLGANNKIAYGYFDETFKGMSKENLNMFLKEKNAYIIYPLEIPIEHDLKPLEIEAYKKLHTNYPTTVIQTGCWNECEYIADPKNYMDKKLQPLNTVQSKLLELESKV